MRGQKQKSREKPSGQAKLTDSRGGQHHHRFPFSKTRYGHIFSLQKLMHVGLEKQKQTEHKWKPKDRRFLHSVTKGSWFLLSAKTKNEQCEGNLITFALFHARVKFYACMAWLGHWLGPVIRWLGLVQPYRPGWVQPEKKIFKKNSFKKIYDFPQIFYCILINIGLYFYTVKIQIHY
jgi:hypothetical protein